MDSGSHTILILDFVLVSLQMTFDNALLLTFSMTLLILHEIAFMLGMLKRIGSLVRHLQSF